MKVLAKITRGPSVIRSLDQPSSKINVSQNFLDIYGFLHQQDQHGGKITQWQVQPSGKINQPKFLKSLAKLYISCTIYIWKKVLTKAIWAEKK